MFDLIMQSVLFLEGLWDQCFFLTNDNMGLENFESKFSLVLVFSLNTRFRFIFSLFLYKFCDCFNYKISVLNRNKVFSEGSCDPDPLNSTLLENILKSGLLFKEDHFHFHLTRMCWSVYIYGHFIITTRRTGLSLL